MHDSGYKSALARRACQYSDARPPRKTDGILLESETPPHMRGKAYNNGTLELAAKKFLRLSGGHVAITPVIMYLIGYIVAAIGPGCVPALGIAAALSLPLGKSTGYNSVMLAAIGQIGSMAGRFSPITPESVLIYNLASEQGITDYQTHTLIYATITTIVLSIIIFLVFKGFQIKEPQSKEKEILPAFTQKQIITLVGFLAMIVASAFFKRNVGLISFAVAVVLLLLNVADEKVVIKGVPWSTLLMVTGIGMLMNIVSAYPDLNIVVDLATTFGCPFEGKYDDPQAVVDFLKDYIDAGMTTCCLCDTIGIADPAQVKAVIGALKAAYPTLNLQVHFHDTRGLGMVNTMAAIESGITEVQSALGGLGGCPFAPGASGNLSTEDMIWMLNEMGYETGIEFSKVLAAAKYQASHIPGNYSGHHIHIEQETPCKF